MPWHPPIPFGALYTIDALKIGPAISLLGYCYDKVGRNGQLQLNLRIAAGDMGVPYPTVKRWWEMLKQTEYIETHEERGRAGMDVQMSDAWLDWWRETGSEVIPNNNNQYRNGITSDPVSTETGQKRDRNGIKNDPDRSMYKVLIDSDQAEYQGVSEDRDRTARTHPPAIALLFEVFPHAEVSAEQTDDICSTVIDLALWREVLTTWRANGYKPRVGNLLDRYRKAAKEHRNGSHIRQSTGSNPERRPQVEADLDKPL